MVSNGQIKKRSRTREIERSFFHKHLIPLGNAAQWQGEEALLRSEELGKGTVVGDESGDNTKGASSLGDVNLSKT
jgi:hypothetical protein